MGVDMTRALIIVDMQRDFIEGGALGVIGGAAVDEKMYDFVTEHADEYTTFAFTKDWHNAPPDTNGGHFSKNPDYVDSWPVHCVSETPMSDFAPGTKRAFNRLNRLYGVTRKNIFFKGQGKPDYSGFQGYNPYSISLEEFLSDYGVTDVDIVGIAGDYCVRQTALDAVRLGFKTRVLPELIASVGGGEATKNLVKEIND